MFFILCVGVLSLSAVSSARAPMRSKVEPAAIVALVPLTPDLGIGGEGERDIGSWKIRRHVWASPDEFLGDKGGR